MSNRRRSTRTRRSGLRARLRFRNRHGVAVALLLAAGLLGPAALANEWTNLDNNQPGRKDGHMMAYDSQSNRVIMFGDHTSSFDPQTWAYDPVANVWSAMFPANPPSSRSHAAMVYDVQSDRVIEYGGQAQGGGALADTWVYDFDSNSWTLMPAGASTPGERVHYAMAYDAQSDRVILHGGVPNLSDTWAYDYDTNSWEQRASGPPGLQRHAMTYDSLRDRVLLVGQGETWAYDYENDQWTRLNSSAPALVQGAATPEMAYDAQSDRTILYNDDSLTWAFDHGANSWTNMNTTSGPVVHHFDMVYVDSIDRVILYGGRGTGSQPPQETWSYNFDDDTGPTPPPPPTGLSVN